MKPDNDKPLPKIPPQPTKKRQFDGGTPSPQDQVALDPNLGIGGVPQ